MDPFLHAAITEAKHGLAEGGIPIGAVLYSTLSPCDMCSGTALLYKIPKIIIGENRTFQGPEAYLRRHGVALVIVQNAECIQLMRDFIAARPEVWNEDIGM
jgi:cytosine/creatinine deaminase